MDATERQKTKKLTQLIAKAFNFPLKDNMDATERPTKLTQFIAKALIFPLKSNMDTTERPKKALTAYCQSI